ncbi:hypothetical protein D9M71_250430 [compost metagenome]
MLRRDDALLHHLSIYCRSRRYLIALGRLLCLSNTLTPVEAPISGVFATGSLSRCRHTALSLVNCWSSRASVPVFPPVVEKKAPRYRGLGHPGSSMQMCVQYRQPIGAHIRASRQEFLPCPPSARLCAGFLVLAGKQSLYQG